MRGIIIMNLKDGAIYMNYKTTQIAQAVGIHPNTVRLYEQIGFISRPERQPNGYRVFTDLHLEQLKLVRTGLCIEVMQNGLRKLVIRIIKTCASGHIDEAVRLCELYIQQIVKERAQAEEAIRIAQDLLKGNASEPDVAVLSRKETADFLNISMDTLRNWEMNGLLTVKRKQNGYRTYTGEDIRRLKIIRSLRCANYSLSSILRMLTVLSNNPEADMRKAIDSPDIDDNVISVCDRLLTSLQHAEENAHIMRATLSLIKKYS